MKAPLIAAAFVVGGLPSVALAAEPKEPQYDEAALKAALDEAPGSSKKIEKAGSPLDVLPPAPRKRGIVVEGSLGMMEFLGKLNTISPAASMLHLQLGIEPLRWLMLFGEGDIAFTSTRYSPPSRGYLLYAFGGGARVTLGLTERFSFYGQVDFGVMKASSNILHSYGFYRAENFNGYVGGTGGIEWYQANPHYALALYAGARRTQGLDRFVPGDVAITVLGGVAVRYAF